MKGAGCAISSLARSSARPHNGGMAKPKPEITFRPVEWKILPEWYVLVTLPDAKELRIGGFKTEANAHEWIAKSSAAWIKEHNERKRSRS
jgi:hypothetical protein